MNFEMMRTKNCDTNSVVNVHHCITHVLYVNTVKKITIQNQMHYLFYNHQNIRKAEIELEILKILYYIGTKPKITKLMNLQFSCHYISNKHKNELWIV